MQTSDPGAVGPDEQLARATQVRLEARHLEERIESARKRAGASTADAAAAASTLSDEERDVQRLQSVSWARLLAAVKGSRMTDLERETAERERARYEAGVAAAHAQSDLRELESLESQLAALGDVEAAYTAALNAKEEWVRGHDPQVAQRLEEIAAERGRVAAEDHEAVEAYDAGVTAHRHLADAAQLLDSARSWSTWDTFGGGGLITDMVKYDKLDQVHDELRRADAALRAFSHELADVHQPAVQALDISQLTTAFDVFFDNIFSDWAVRDRIVNALDKVQGAARHIEAALGVLTQQRSALESRQTALGEERTRLLAG